MVNIMKQFHELGQTEASCKKTIGMKQQHGGGVLSWISEYR